MQRLILASTLALTLAAVALAAKYVESVDDGFIISYDGGALDPIGETKLAYTKATRDCSQVTRLNPEQMKALLSGIAATDWIKEHVAQPRGGWQFESWALIETDFDNIEPAVLLLKKRPNSVELAADYGGTAAPFNDTQVIHEHFLGRRPDVPRNLVLCYSPLGGPFNRAS